MHVLKITERMCTAENLALAVSSLGVSGLTLKKQIIIIIIIGLSLSFKFLTSYNLNCLTNKLCPPLHSTEGFLRRSLYVFKKKSIDSCPQPLSSTSGITSYLCNI